MKDSFWIFTHLGLGDAICCNALFRHFSTLYSDRMVIIPVWSHNLSSVQWMLSDCGNVFFYEIETEQQLLTCRDSIPDSDKLCLGFYEESFHVINWKGTDQNEKEISDNVIMKGRGTFNPVLWDSEFYRQAGLPASLKYEGFRLPEADCPGLVHGELAKPFIFCHQDEERGFNIRDVQPHWMQPMKGHQLKNVICGLYHAEEIHVIDSAFLNLADLIPDLPNCKRFVFHRYARRGLPPSLKKQWEILD